MNNKMIMHEIKAVYINDGIIHFALDGRNDGINEELLVWEQDENWYASDFGYYKAVVTRNGKLLGFIEDEESLEVFEVERF